MFLGFAPTFVHLKVNVDVFLSFRVLIGAAELTFMHSALLWLFLLVVIAEHGDLQNLFGQVVSALLEIHSSESPLSAPFPFQIFQIWGGAREGSD